MQTVDGGLSGGEQRDFCDHTVICLTIRENSNLSLLILAFPCLTRYGAVDIMGERRWKGR